MSNGALQFWWIYLVQDLGPDAIVNTLKTVDPHGLQARHEVNDSDTKFGWDGNESRILPPDTAFTPPPRFCALRPSGGNYRRVAVLTHRLAAAASSAEFLKFNLFFKFER